MTQPYDVWKCDLHGTPWLRLHETTSNLKMRLAWHMTWLWLAVSLEIHYRRPWNPLNMFVSHVSHAWPCKITYSRTFKMYVIVLRLLKSSRIPFLANMFFFFFFYGFNMVLNTICRYVFFMAWKMIFFFFFMVSIWFWIWSGKLFMIFLWFWIWFFYGFEYDFFMVLNMIFYGFEYEWFW